MDSSQILEELSDLKSEVSRLASRVEGLDGENGASATASTTLAALIVTNDVLSPNPAIGKVTDARFEIAKVKIDSNGRLVPITLPDNIRFQFPIPFGSTQPVSNANPLAANGEAIFQTNGTAMFNDIRRVRLRYRIDNSNFRFSPWFTLEPPASFLQVFFRITGDFGGTKVQALLDLN